MLKKMRKVYILVFLIAQVLVFRDANGFSELPATTPMLSIAAIKTITHTQVAPTTRSLKLAPRLAAGATATLTTTTPSPTISTLAFSNAPTITNDTDAISLHVYHSKLKQSHKPFVVTPTSTRRISSQLTVVQPKIKSAAVTTVAATVMKNVGSVMKVEAVANSKNETRAGMLMVTAHDAGSRNESKPRIKIAKEYTKWVNTKSTNSGLNSLSETKNTQGVLTTANQQTINATTVRVNFFQAGRSRSEEMQSVSEAAMPSTLERQVKNGLYLNKSAQIVTDEFSDLLRSELSAETKVETGVLTPAPLHKHGLNANEITRVVVPQQKQRRQQQHKVTNLQLQNNVGISDSASNDRNDKSTLYDNNKNNGSYNYKNNSNDKPNYPNAMSGKLDIADLYPVPLEDLIPIIRDSNVKLLRERTIFPHTDAEAKEHRQNLLPNEEVMQPKEQAAFVQNINTANKEVNRIPPPLLVSNNVAQPGLISDFTGKLLEEQDGVITEIEQKFRLSEFTVTESSKIPTTEARSFFPTASARNMPGKDQFSYSVNHKIILPSSHGFIDRRVKKSFDFPMHRTSSDVMAMPHIDFVNTKFNTDVTGGGDPASQKSKQVGESATANDRATTKSGKAAGHPEFSTTKFYNSKELYNEMMQHNRQKFKLKAATTTASAVVAFREYSAGTGFAGLPNPKLETFTKSGHGLIYSSNPITSANRWNHVVRSTIVRPTVMRVALTATSPPISIATEAEKSPTTIETSLKKIQNDLKRTKLLLKSIMLPSGSSAAATTTETISDSTMAPNEPVNGTAVNTPTAVTSTNLSTLMLSTGKSGGNVSATNTFSESTALGTVGVNATRSNAMPLLASSASSLQMAVTTTDTMMTKTKMTETTLVQHTTNSTRSTSKPIVRSRILSRLQEKVNSLECELQNVPRDSHLWRGNETHELLLPIMTSEICPPNGVDCAPILISWEGEAEIQSGDILIVEINDALLNPNDANNTNSARTTQVYQVTRTGHEHCDATEGILLDITPLVVDGRKLVTLYDKDLTEGINLLIVVSDLWGSQCVRLKVTTKTDNCGENAECSGKGVCYSNEAMEEYECQCCSGFAGPHCEEIDACTPSPCTNNGICVDLSQGHEGNSYQCLCPYGYAGINCQYESDPCNSAECMNGGSCVGNSTHFRCDCMPGFTGPLCQHSLNECESSPCIHGICVDQEDGFRCFCQPGFAGELCNFEYNECESNPCQNDGECIDHIGNYECRCTKGYTGVRCQIKVDFCTNKPCPSGHRCIDHGNDFSCECPEGRNGPECNQMPRAQCNVNPCTHGGTCWSSGDSFYCACRAGYTGSMCEDEFVVETVVSSSEFMVDDTSARNFNDKTFGSSVVLKSPIELHNAYFAAGVLAAAIFIVAIVVTICHCKVNQTYRKFSTRSSNFFPILGFGRRHKSQAKLNKHWLSGKGLSSGNSLRSSPSSASRTPHRHLPSSHGGSGDAVSMHAQNQQGGQLHERPFQRHLAMNLENDMYYTVDFSEHSQHSPLIQ